MEMELQVRNRWIRRAVVRVFSFSCFLAFVTILLGTFKPSIDPGLEIYDEQYCERGFLQRSNILIRPLQLNNFTHQPSEIASLLGGPEYAHLSLRTKKASCKFRYFTKGQVVECFDNLRLRRLRELSKILNVTQNSLSNRPYHVAFVGDSRIRQHFFSLFQYIPVYDVEISSLNPELHMDRYIKSRMLNLVLSFSWRPSLTAPSGVNVTNTLNTWLNNKRLLDDDPTSNTPDFLLIGFALHDMLRENNGTPETYATALQRVKPQLKEIAKTSRVIWYNAYTTSELTFKEWKPNELSPLKVRQYNRIARDSGIEIWDSTDPIVEEHIRACALLFREAEDLWGVTVEYKCSDMVHAGSAAMNPSTHVLLNELCYSASSHTS